VRLDLEVSRRFGLSRRAAREAVRAGRVDVGGRTVDAPGVDVPEGSSVELVRDRPAKRVVRTRLEVLHEDADVIVVDKPAGLLTVPTEARERDTLWSRVLQYLQLKHGGRPYAGIVHRLDKDTSGAVVFARHRRALHALQDRFRAHDIDREYVALVSGRPPDEGTFDADLVRTRELRRSVARPGEEGRRAVTRFRVVERVAGAALVSIRPETGRTHQIRVHFSAAGFPVLGDRVYGPRDRDRETGADAPRQMLHARRLGFVLPERERVSVEAPLPEDFRRELASRRGRASEGGGAAVGRAPGGRERRPGGHGSAQKETRRQKPARRNHDSGKATRGR
jgi:23S rRNA pseudouridine1911/1915/1917 synthase